MDRRRCCGPPTTAQSRSHALLIANKAAVDAANDFGITALLQASGVGDSAMVDLLLRSGANPNKAHPEGETPLLAASRSGSVPTVRLLLTRGVDVNAAEKFQNTTAVMWAAAEGHVDVVDVLHRGRRRHQSTGTRHDAHATGIMPITRPADSRR